jgi:hypothetical protein
MPATEYDPSSWSGHNEPPGRGDLPAVQPLPATRLNHTVSDNPRVLVVLSCGPLPLRVEGGRSDEGNDAAALGRNKLMTRWANMEDAAGELPSAAQWSSNQAS